MAEQLLRELGLLPAQALLRLRVVLLSDSRIYQASFEPPQPFREVRRCRYGGGMICTPACDEYSRLSASQRFDC